MKAMMLDDLERATRRRFSAPVYDLVQFTRPWNFSLREIRVPIRFWHGDADNLVPLAHAEHMASLVPDAELHVRPGEGHIGNLDAVNDIFTAILDVWPPTCRARRIPAHGTGRSARERGRHEQANRGTLQ
jgi:pimeloyl-ACP methyl ester carboxylesterase